MHVARPALHVLKRVAAVRQLSLSPPLPGVAIRSIGLSQSRLSSTSSTSSSWRRPANGDGATLSVDEARRLLTITWPVGLAGGGSGDEATSILPLAWLRDSCKCSECFNSMTQSRSLHFKDFNPRVPVKAATMSADSSTLTVEWQDGHCSSYSRLWLQSHSFTDEARQRRRSGLMFTTKEKIWIPKLEEFSFTELMSDDSTLLKMLRHLDRCGCLLMKGAPPEISALPKFADRIAGLLSPCNYGQTFEVKSKIQPSNAAYTSGYLGLHIDQCFYDRRPGVQILHCISQPSDGSIRGGESLLADGFLAASIMKRSHPEYYRALTSLPIDFNDYGRDFVGDFHFINREPVLRLNDMGEVDRVTFSGHTRDYHQNHLPADRVQLLYDALKAFYDVLSKPPCVIEHKMQTGDIQVTDNRRVLHGRLAFSVTDSTVERFLHGGYVEWDELYSRIRRLEEAKE